MGKRGQRILPLSAIAALVFVIAASIDGCARSNDVTSNGDASAESIADGAIDRGPVPDVQSPLGTPDDAGDILSGCATATAKVDRQPIYMLILLDGSGSMNDESKWAAVVPALDYFIDDLNAQGDPSFGVGLTIFSDVNDATNGAGPYPNIDVPIAFMDDAQAKALHARLDGTSPKGPTPTLAVLNGQYPRVEAFTPSAPLLPNGKKVVVLMTDGVPYPDPDVQNGPCIRAAKDEFARTSPAGPITTFAVGIGHFFPYDPSIYDPEFLGDLAVAGGAPNDGCLPHELLDVTHMCHFQITPAAAGSALTLEHDLLAAFDKIRSKVTSCTLTLEKSDGGAAVDPSKVNVVFTGTNGVRTVLSEDPKDGWSYDDPNAPSQVILNGASCKALKSDPDGKLSVVLGCKSIVK